MLLLVDMFSTCLHETFHYPCSVIYCLSPSNGKPYCVAAFAAESCINLCDNFTMSPCCSIWPSASFHVKTGVLIFIKFYIGGIFQKKFDLIVTRICMWVSTFRWIILLHLLRWRWRHLLSNPHKFHLLHFHLIRLHPLFTNSVERSFGMLILRECNETWRFYYPVIESPPVDPILSLLKCLHTHTIS